MFTPEELCSLFTWILRSSLQASVLALLILAAQALLRERVAPRWRHALWLLLVVRLVVPWAPASRWSVFNLTPALSPAAGPGSAAPAALAEADPGEPEQASMAAPPDALVVQGQNAGADDEPVLNLQSAIQGRRPGGPSGPQSALDPFNVLAWLWLSGVAVLTGAVLVQSLSLSRLLRGQRAVTDGRTLELLESCKAAMRVRAWLVVVESPGARSPALFGFVRPRLLLPAGAIETLSETQLRHVFLHELAHLKRGDIALNWLLALLQALHWFNPLLWLAFRRMRGDREMACDAMAMGCLSPDEAPDYGRTIVRLLEQFSIPRRLPGLACILEEKNQIKRRIMMIAKFRKHSLAWSFAAALLMIVLGGAGLTGAAQTRSPLSEKAQAAAKARLEAAEKKLAAAKARHEAGVATTEEFANAQGDLKIAQAEVTGDPKAVLQAKLEKAQTDLKLKQAMFKAGLLPELQLKQAEGRVKIAQAQLSGDKRAAAQAQLDLATAILKSTRTRFDAGLTGQAELAKAEAAMKAAEAALAKAPKSTVTAPAHEEKTLSYSITRKPPEAGRTTIKRVITHTTATTPHVWMRTITPDGTTIEVQPPSAPPLIIKRQVLPAPGGGALYYHAPGAPTPGTALRHSLEGQQRAIEALKAQRDQTYKSLDENIQRMERSLEEQRRGGGDPAKIQPKIMPRSVPPIHSEFKIDSMVPGGGGGMSGGGIRTGNLALGITGVDVKPYREGGLFEAAIVFKNNGAKPLPLFDVQFYRDEKERAEGVMNGAGPIEPGASFSEGSRPFALKEGENKITIQVDPNKKAPGLEKTDFRAEIQVTVKDGKIVKKGTSIRQSQGGASRMEYKINSSSSGTGGGGGSMSFSTRSSGTASGHGSSGGGSSFERK